MTNKILPIIIYAQATEKRLEPPYRYDDNGKIQYSKWDLAQYSRKFGKYHIEINIENLSSSIDGKQLEEIHHQINAEIEKLKNEDINRDKILRIIFDHLKPYIDPEVDSLDKFNKQFINQLHSGRDPKQGDILTLGEDRYYNNKPASDKNHILISQCFSTECKKLKDIHDELARKYNLAYEEFTMLNTPFWDNCVKYKLVNVSNIDQDVSKNKSCLISFSSKFKNLQCDFSVDFPEETNAEKIKSVMHSIKLLLELSPFPQNEKEIEALVSDVTQCLNNQLISVKASARANFRHKVRGQQ